MNITRAMTSLTPLSLPALPTSGLVPVASSLSGGGRVVNILFNAVSEGLLPLQTLCSGIYWKELL